MPEAMDRFLTVNDFPASGDEFEARGLPQELPSSDDLFPAAVRSQETQPRLHGCCLYFGPSGERCSRPAGEGGFCPRHQADGPAADSNSRPILGRVMTGFGILALILPILLDVLRALARWLASH